MSGRRLVQRPALDIPGANRLVVSVGTVGTVMKPA